MPNLIHINEHKAAWFHKQNILKIEDKKEQILNELVFIYFKYFVSKLISPGLIALLKREVK